MTEPFENEVSVIVGTQKVLVDPAGRVTIVNAGPVGPPGLPGDGEAGDYAPLLHEHSRYAHYAYSVGFDDITSLGGTYNNNGSVTHTFMGFIPDIPEGTTLLILLRNSPNPAFDKGYIYTTAVSPAVNDWVLQPYDEPFNLEGFNAVGKYISINFDFTLFRKLFGVLRYTGAWSIEELSWADHTHPLPVNVFAPIIHTHPVSAITDAQVDVRESAQEFLRDEWERRTAPVMLTNQSLEAMNPSFHGPTWAITRATTRGTLPHTPAGLDIQWFGKVLRPYTQAEIDASGLNLTIDPPGFFYQTFYELITLLRPSITNDWFEWARFLGNTVSPSKGRAGYFFEGTIIGGESESSNNLVFDTGVEVGQPERARMTLDTQTSTLTFWNWMPYHNGDPTLEKCPNGHWWKPVISQIDPSWASMADPETETVPANPADGYIEGNPEVILPWRIGIQGRLEIGEFFMYEFGSTDPLVHIDSEVLEAAGVGVSSFVDGTDVNTISTETAYTAPGPAARFVAPESALLLPSPAGQPDGKIVKVVNERWVVGDDIEGASFPTYDADVSGDVYSQPGPYGTFSTYVSTLAEAAFTAVFLPAGTYTELFIYCSVAGNVTVRLCLDSVGPNGLPQTLLKDAGTTSTAGSPGFKTAVMAAPWVNAEDRWVWCRVQTEAVVSATTVQVLNGQAGNQWPPWPTLPSSSNASRGICGGRVLGHAIGPNTQPLDSATPTFILNSPGSPRVWVRRA